jgi:16S rRNA (adenine1518-N6/adenine1519-N6)-dimethyltransferase
MHRPKLGQHFLRDPHAIQTILGAAELKPTDRVLEIGPGRGALTDHLVSRVRDFTAIELDRNLASRLESQGLNQGTCRIIQGDVLKVDLNSVFPNASPEHPIKILGNLPYSIASAIFEKILAWPGWDTGIFLVQREVGNRMRSLPGSRTYGVLSLAVQLYAETELILKVKPGAFSPPPRVHSVVIRLRRRKTLPLAEPDIPAFFDLVHASFSHRRKTLANSLAFFTHAPKARVEDWLTSRGLAANRRAETLALADYVRLTPPWQIFRRQTSLTP